MTVDLTPEGVAREHSIWACIAEADRLTQAIFVVLSHDDRHRFDPHKLLEVALAEAPRHGDNALAALRDMLDRVNAGATLADILKEPK